MRRLAPVLIRELTYFARECVKWTLVGVVCLAGMWFLTAGLPQIVAVINGEPPARAIHLILSQLDPLYHVTSQR